MKPNRDATELAARLGAAANKPVPLPLAPVQVSTEIKPIKPATKKTSKPASDTVGITLRPERALLTRYILAAAERTRLEERIVSAQEVMIEVLDKWP